MIKRVLLYVLAAAFAVIGVIGLLVPVIPGILFLLLAAVCVSLASDRVHDKFSSNRHYRQWRSRWDASEGLSTVNRAKLAFWLTVDATVGATRRLRLRSVALRQGPVARLVLLQQLQHRRGPHPARGQRVTERQGLRDRRQLAACAAVRRRRPVRDDAGPLRPQPDGRFVGHRQPRDAR